MATKQDIRNEGFRRGQAVASWVDMPEIGTELPRGAAGFTFKPVIVTAANRYDVWERLCYESDRRGEDPAFRETERWIEGLAASKPYEVWEVFNAGLRAGIAAYGRRHHATELANASTEGV